MGLYRQAANLAPNIDTCKRERLNWLLGGSEWERAWYSTPHGPFDLFGGRAEAIRIADVTATERFVKTRLENVFEGGVLEPRRYHNVRGHPLGVTLLRSLESPRRTAGEANCQFGSSPPLVNQASAGNKEQQSEACGP